jgi:4-amino-4-deoxy-L-arabinose transferase-like glycosyltransferase
MMLQAGWFAIGLFIVSVMAAGAVSLMVWSEHRRLSVSSSRASEMDWLEAVFVSLVGIAVFAGWVGTILASWGVFSLAALSVIMLAVAGAVIWLRWPVERPEFSRPGIHEFALILLLLGCGVVYFRPHEYVLGSTDAGSYMNTGAEVARTGGLVVDDEWTRLLSEFGSVTLRQQPPGWLTRQLQFVGWYIDDRDPGRVVPQFYPFHPTWIAIGIGLAGLPGGLLVTPVWGILSIAAVYLASRRWFGASAGLLAALLLALTPTHIWFARYPTTEPLTLLLVFTGLLAFQTLWDEPSAGPVWGIFGASVLGAAFLTRIDLPVVALAVIVAIIVRWRQGRWTKGWTAYTLTLGLFLLHALLSALFINWPYFWNTYSAVIQIVIGSSLPVLVVGLGAAFLLLVGLIVLRRNRARLAACRWGRLARSSGLRWSLIALVVYGISWPSGNQYPVLNGQNWVRLGWYLTPLGLLLATLGLAEILRRGSLDRLGLFLAVGGLTIIQYVYNIFSTPYHIYAMRRYVPIVIPMLMIYAAVAIVAVSRVRKGWLSRLGGGSLALVLMAGLVYQARFVLPQRDLRGAVEQLTHLDERLKPDAVVLISEPSESLFADTFGVPLRFVFSHDIATVRRDDASVLPFIERMMKYAAEQSRPVQLIAVDPIAPAVRQALSLQPVEMFPMTLQMLMNTYHDYPAVIQTAYYGVEIYDVVGLRSPRTLDQSQPIEIDVGTFDTPFIRTGFYGKEPLPGDATMRWTAGEAALDIPLPTEEPITVDVRAMIYRPEGVPADAVTVWLDRERVGEFTPGETWQIFSFPAQPRPVRGISSLQFQAMTFNPASLQINNDSRDLGFLVDWVKIAIQ